MKLMLRVIQLFSIAFFLFSLGACERRGAGSPVIAPLPIDAQISGDTLTGPSVLNDSNRFVWGGSVLKGKDGKYHMVYSSWECGDSIPPFSDSWLLYSTLACAVSDYPDRNFQFQGIILRGKAIQGDSAAWDAQMVHNPHLKEFNGKYYLYYVGASDPGVQPLGSKGENVNKRNRVQQSQKIGVIEFENFDDLLQGNFRRPDHPLLTPRTRVKENDIVNPSPGSTTPMPDNIIVTNPSVVYRPGDNKFLMYFKGNIYDPNWKGVHGVALADSPLGPFIATDEYVFDIKLDDGTLASSEDPYVWYHKGNRMFYAVIKDFSGRITGSEPGLAILESIDGIKWTQTEVSFFLKKELTLKNGNTIKVNRLERPQLLLDENGNPLVLYAACSLVDLNSRTDGVSFNVHIPLKSAHSRIRQ